MTIDLGALSAAAFRRDKACVICAISARAVLCAHHIIPVELGGRDVLSNILTLCANCHRSVHWLATADRSLDAHAYGLCGTRPSRRRILELARRIRTRRLRVVSKDRTMSRSISLSEALDAVVARNGFEETEAATLRRCFNRAWRAIHPSDQRGCSRRLTRGGRFLSVNANNHLALRVPAWTDDGYRDEADIVLIWPQGDRPSGVSSGEFRRVSSGRFRLIPYVNLWLTWEECLSLTPADWRIYGNAVHHGLTLVRSARRVSNVLPG
jgi:hypothetical protein